MQSFNRPFGHISANFNPTGKHLCAVKNGISIDTTMGLGLQCGVLQNNRIGDMDPYIIFHLVEECGMELGEVKKMLQSQSGLLGLSGGVSNDLRDIQEAADNGNEDCQNALKAYAYGIKKYIGAYTAAMGGVDAIVFGGGVSRAGQPILDGVRKSFKKWGYHACQDTQFRLATLGNDAGAYGAFKLVAE